VSQLRGDRQICANGGLDDSLPPTSPPDSSEVSSFCGIRPTQKPSASGGPQTAVDFDIALASSAKDAASRQFDPDFCGVEEDELRMPQEHVRPHPHVTPRISPRVVARNDDPAAKSEPAGHHTSQDGLKASRHYDFNSPADTPRKNNGFLGAELAPPSPKAFEPVALGAMHNDSKQSLPEDMVADLDNRLLLKQMKLTEHTSAAREVERRVAAAEKAALASAEAAELASVDNTFPQQAWAVASNIAVLKPDIGGEVVEEWDPSVHNTMSPPSSFTLRVASGVSSLKPSDGAHISDAAFPVVSADAVAPLAALGIVSGASIAASAAAAVVKEDTNQALASGDLKLGEAGADLASPRGFRTDDVDPGSFRNIPEKPAEDDPVAMLRRYRL